MAASSPKRHRRATHSRACARLPDVPLRLAVAGSGPIEDELHARYGSDPRSHSSASSTSPGGHEPLPPLRHSSTRPCPEGLPTSSSKQPWATARSSRRRAAPKSHLPRPRLDRRRRVVPQLTDALIARPAGVTDPVPPGRPVPSGLRVREHFTWASVARSRLRHRRGRGAPRRDRQTWGADLRSNSWTLHFVAIMRLPIGPDLGMTLGSGPPDDVDAQAAHCRDIYIATISNMLSFSPRGAALKTLPHMPYRHTITSLCPPGRSSTRRCSTSYGSDTM